MPEGTCPLYQDLLLAFAPLASQALARDSCRLIKLVIQGCDDPVICAVRNHPGNESVAMLQFEGSLACLGFGRVAVSAP